MFLEDTGRAFRSSIPAGHQGRHYHPALSVNKRAHRVRPKPLVVMDLLWDCSGLYDALPAAVMVDECLESSLSVLTRRQGTDTRAHTVNDVSDLYEKHMFYSCRVTTFALYILKF